MDCYKILMIVPLNAPKCVLTYILSQGKGKKCQKEGIITTSGDQNLLDTCQSGDVA